MLFTATWVVLEGIMLSEISQTKTNSICYYLYVEFNEVKISSDYTRKKKIHGYREQTTGYHDKRGEGREGKIGVGIKRSKLVCIKK